MPCRERDAGPIARVVLWVLDGNPLWRWLDRITDRWPSGKHSWLAFLLLAALGLAACDGGGVTRSPEDSGAWLRIERSAMLAGSRLNVACDTLSGDRLYILGAGSGGAAITIVPGGCK